jgi:hypothetical protein
MDPCENINLEQYFGSANLRNNDHTNRYIKL